MTAQEQITKFVNMVEDELDSDYMLQLLNDAKNEVEEMRNWEILKGLATFSGAEWDFSEQNFKYAISLTDSSFIDYSLVPLERVKMEEMASNYLYYIDWATNKLKMVNPADTATKYITFAKYTDELELDDSWGFPERFHNILPYKMAELYYASDAGEKSRAWDDRWASQYERALSRMESWDSMLKLRGRRMSRGTNYNPKAINDL